MPPKSILNPTTQATLLLLHRLSIAQNGSEGHATREDEAPIAARHLEDMASDVESYPLSYSKRASKAFQCAMGSTGEFGVRDLFMQ